MPRRNTFLSFFIVSIATWKNGVWAPGLSEGALGGKDLGLGISGLLGSRSSPHDKGQAHRARGSGLGFRLLGNLAMIMILGLGFGVGKMMTSLGIWDEGCFICRAEAYL